MSDVIFIVAAGMQMLGEFVSRIENVPEREAWITIAAPCEIVHTRFPTPQGIALIESFEFLPVRQLEVPGHTPHGIVKEDVTQKYREARARAYGIIVPDGASKPTIER